MVSPITLEGMISQATPDQLGVLAEQTNNPDIKTAAQSALSQEQNRTAWVAPGAEFNVLLGEDEGLAVTGPLNNAVSNDIANTLALVDAHTRSDFTSLPNAMQVIKAEVEQGNGEAITDSIVAAHVQDKQAGLVEALVSNPALADEDGLDGVAEVLKQDREAQKGLDPADVAFVDDYAPIEVTRDPALRDTLAAQFSIARMLAERMSEVGMWDKFTSFASLFIPLRELIGTETITEHFGADSFNDLKDVFTALPPQQQVELATFMVDEGMRVQPNVIITSQLLSKTFDLDPENFDSVQLWSILDFFEIGVIFGATIKLVNKLNGVRKATAVFNKELASAATADAADDAVTASRLNTTTEEVQSTLSASETEFIFRGSVDGIASDAGKIIEKMVGAVRRELDKFNSQPTGVLTTDQFDAVLQKVQDAVDAENTALRSQKLPEVAEILETEKVATGLNVTVRLGDNTTVTLKYDIGADLEQKFTGKLGGGWIAATLATPTNFLKGFTDQLVDTATFLGFQKSKNAKVLEKAAKQAFKGLNKNQIAKVDEVLVEGDDLGKLFNLEDLRSQYGLSDIEASSYFANRIVFDRGFGIVNKAVRRQLEVDGWGYTRLKQAIGSPVESINSTKVFIREATSRPALGARVWDTTTNQMVSIVDDVVDETSVFYRTREPVVVKQDGIFESFDVIRGDKATRSRLPRIVMNKAAGYVPRSRKNINYVVRRNITTTTGRTYQITERLTSRLDDAVATERKLNIEAGFDPDDVNRPFRQERASELSPDQAEDLAINSYGGLITGSRSTRDILFGFDGEKAARLSAVESIEKMMSNIAHVGTVSEWRNQILIKFKNTFGHTLDNPNNLPIQQIPWTNKVTKAGNQTDQAQAEFVQRWIKANLNLPTRDETAFKNTLQAFAESLERIAKPGGKLDSTRNAVLEFSTRDPWAASRAVVFHALLGSFNPVQLLVQGMGFTVAVAIDPANALRNTQRAVIANSLVNFVDKVDNTAMLKSMSDRVWKPFGFSSRDEVVDFVNAYKQSGLRESIRTNADYQMVGSGFSMDRSAISRAATWGKDKSLMFFRAGELWNRSYGFAAAYNEWRKANKGKRLVKASDIQGITQRSTHFTLNLNHANAAQWQSGVTGSIFQFFQINQKFAEAILGFDKNLTKTQRASLLLGQTAMFGTSTAAVGQFVGQDSTWTAKQIIQAADLANRLGIAEDDTEGMADLIRTVENGTVGAMFDFVSSEDFEFSKRFAIGAGLGDAVESLWDAVGKAIDSKPFEMPSTPTTSFAGRVMDLTKHVWTLFSSGAVLDGISKAEFTGVGLATASLFSSARSATKAWILANTGGEVHDTKGRFLFSIEPEETDIMWSAMGFQLSEQQDYYDLLDAARYTQEIENDIVTALSKHILVYRAADLQDPEQVKKLEREMSVMMYHYLPDNPDIRDRVKKATYDRLTEEQYPELLKKVIGKLMEGYEVNTPLPVKE